MRVLVFQHIDCEHPGSLRQFLAEDKVEWDAVNLHLGEPLPNYLQCLAQSQHDIA